ncbi:MAG: GLPGLI family protein [Saprospiraceae bacterium]|nr:GLPGLI family protein [Saprospiraceae bacterium]
MKRLFLLSLFLLTLVLNMVAQNSGEIIYEETMDLHRRMTGDREQFKEFVPQFRTNKMILLFNDHEALYKASEEQNDEVDAGNGERRMRMRFMGAAGGILWQDYMENQRIEERDFMDKKFLITGEPQSFAWKLTGESMEVGKYVCQKATFEDSTRQIVAWFTPMIPVPLGPGEFGQLPGLILHIDINDGERTITAQEINLKEIDQSLIIKPTKGKEVTQEEFRTIVRDKMKEMREQNGGRGFHMMRGERN